MRRTGVLAIAGKRLACNFFSVSCGFPGMYVRFSGSPREPHVFCLCPEIPCLSVLISRPVIILPPEGLVYFLTFRFT